MRRTRGEGYMMTDPITTDYLLAYPTTYDYLLTERADRSGGHIEVTRRQQSTASLKPLLVTSSRQHLNLSVYGPSSP